MKYRILTAICLSISTAAFAHASATGIVKQRMDGMDALKTAVKQMVAMTKADAKFDAAKAKAAATQLVTHSSEIPVLFKEKDTSDPSESKPILWDEFANFTSLAKDLEIASNAALSVDSQDALRSAMRDIGSKCSACHKLYREKKN